MNRVKLSTLVNLNENSQLKVDLNTALADLTTAAESHFRPHICTNGEEGSGVINQISQNPTSANTAFVLQSYLIQSGVDAWLNIRFIIWVDKLSFPKNYVALTPRQTSYVVQRLPEESQQLVLEKIKNWYTQSFLKDMQEALATITAQVEEGDLLLANVQRNRVFDIHGDGIGHDMVPYTEIGIVGNEVVWKLLNGFTFLDRKEDGYARADAFLEVADTERREAAELTLDLVRRLS